MMVSFLGLQRMHAFKLSIIPFLLLRTGVMIHPYNIFLTLVTSTVIGSMIRIKMKKRDRWDEYIDRQKRGKDEQYRTLHFIFQVKSSMKREGERKRRKKKENLVRRSGEMYL